MSGATSRNHSFIDLSSVPPKSALDSMADRFWERVDCGPPDTCWLWKGSRDRHGYGLRVHRKGGKARAHRLAWFLTWGPIPAGLVVMHSCDEPACCNPNHLMLGTQRANLADRDRKGRGVVPVRKSGRWTGKHRRNRSGAR